MTWYLEASKKIWDHLTAPEQGRPKERMALLILASLIAVSGYWFVIESFAPHRNVLRRGWAATVGTPYQIISGGSGGVYIKIGDLVETATEDGIPVENRELGKDESASDNIRRVLDTPFAFGLCQEDDLIHSGVERDQVRIVGPVYDERMHVLYRSSKLEEISAVLSATDVEQVEHVLDLESSQAVRKFIASARVRTSSKTREAGKAGIADHLLNLSGAQPAHYVPANFTRTVTRLTLGADDPDAIDLAFMMGGAPLQALRDKFLGASSDLCLMPISPRLVRELNASTNARYHSASLGGVYDGSSGGGMTFGVRAMLIASSDVPASVVRLVAQAICDAQQLAGSDIELDTFGALARVATSYPSVWGERVETAFLTLTIVVGIFVLVLVIAGHFLSKFKEIGYSRAVTNIYNEHLPANDKLQREEGALPLPVSAGDSQQIAGELIEGLSRLLTLSMRIRNNYESGGLTIQHHAHLIETTYSIRSIFQNHLGRRLIDLAMAKRGVTQDAARRLYTGGYLLRDDYDKVVSLLAQRSESTLAPGGSGGVGRSFADGAKSESSTQ